MSREVLDSRSSYDEVYDDRPERAPRRRSPLRIRIPRSWLTKLRSIAPLVIAFVVGLVIGGAGWNEWQAQRAIAAARSAVSFTAQISSADTASGGIETYVRLTNEGPEAVTIGELDLSASAIRSSSRRDVDPIEVLPDKEKTTRVVLEVDCSLVDSSQPTLRMQVQTIDRVARSAELPVEDNDNWLANATAVACPDPNDGYVPLQVAYNGASSVVDDGGPALHMPISLGLYEPMDVTVLTMRSASRKLSVSVDGLPLEIIKLGVGDSTLTATWRVLDCQDAEDLRFEEFVLVAETQRPGGNVITNRLYPEPDLVLDVAKFVGNTCRTS